jgi:DNA-binding XRE family transcriptional regulator
VNYNNIINRTQGGEYMRKISLAGARVTAGLTQKDLAEKLGVSRTSINKWEKGKQSITPIHLIAYCKICGFETDEIFLP